MCPEGAEPEAPGAPNYCINCGARLLPGSNFCTVCGRPLRPDLMPPQPAAPYVPYAPNPAPRSSAAREIITAFGTYGVVALAVLMAINVAISIWGIDLVWPHLDKHIYLFVITPFIVNFAELGGGAFFGYYIFLVSAITASFAWMLYKSAAPLKDELQLRSPKGGHSPLYVMGTILFAVLTFNVIYYFIIEYFGASATTPSFDTRELWQLIYGFAQASVWEEVASRVLLIGIPLLVIDSLLRIRDPKHQMKSLFPRIPTGDSLAGRLKGFLNVVSRYILGGGFTIGRKEAALMAFSSIMFGAAHVFSWDLFKIFPAAVAGLAFAYLYLRLGLYASIMLHFAVDFMTIPINVWPGSAADVTIGLMLLVWLAIGIPYMVLYFSKGVGWLLGRRIWPDLPPKAAPQPAYAPYYPVYAPPAGYPTPQYSPVPRPPAGSGANGDGRGFICPSCGNREAVYTEGKLVCTKCGSKV